MLLVFLLAAALWGLGAAMGAPHRLRWVLIGILWLAVIALHLTLPFGHPLREATGESHELWLLVAGAFGLVLVYRGVLRRLRARVTARQAVQGPARAETFSEPELERYARHMILREIGGPGQKRLKTARVLVIGAGGLGSPALMYLAASGVGTLGIIDDDDVEFSNLQRQVIHKDSRVYMPKVHSAAEAIKELNPFVAVRPYQRRLTADLAPALFEDYDIVLDGSDNFETRYVANAAAHGLGLPLVSGALAQWEGQVSVFDTARGTPCYRCVFEQAPDPALAPSCAEAGVLSPLPGIIGSIMAAETVKLITGAGTPLRNEMMIYDALHAESRKFTLARREDCPVCGLQGERHEPAAQ